MAFENKIIEGKKVELYHKPFKVNGHEYLVHENKLWRVAGRQQSEGETKICVERESEGVRKWIAQKDVEGYVVSNHGYISL